MCVRCMAFFDQEFSAMVRKLRMSKTDGDIVRECECGEKIRVTVEFLTKEQNDKS